MSTYSARSTRATEAYQEIRRRILILQIQPGARLKEESWSESLGLGRLAIREALTRLHGEGLLTRGEKGGFFVAKMTERDVHEIREIREVLEVAAVRLAEGRITAAQLGEMEAACDDFAYMANRQYAVGACEADRKFHHLIIAAAGNSKLAHAYEACHIPLFHLRTGQTREYMNDYEQTEREHRGIVKALRSGNFESAAKLLRQHFARGESATLGLDRAR